MGFFAFEVYWQYEDNQWAVLITVYRPDPDRWINFRKRRENDVTL